MIGGDWPIVKLSGGYERAMRAVIRALDGLTPAEQAAVRSETAVEVYRLDA